MPITSSNGFTDDIALEYHRNLLDSPTCIEYLTSRRISLACASAMCIGYVTNVEYSRLNERLVFPYRDLNGQIITYQGRAMYDYEGANQPKYWHTSFEKPKHLMGLYDFGEEITKIGKVLVVEGPFDIAALWMAGIPSVTSLGTSFSSTHAMLLKQFADEVITWYDPDEAGQKATAQTGDHLRQWGLSHRRLNSNLDPADFLVKHGAEKLRRFVWQS